MKIDEKIEIARELQEYHYFFRAFWDICNIKYTDTESDVDTAAVSFDTKGNCIELLINKKFWDSLDSVNRNFLICHECLHVILEHAKRFIEYHGKPTFHQMNIAADIVINELLRESFKFERKDLIPRIAKDGCWLDTVKFVATEKILANESTEYYFNRLLSSEAKKHKTLDKHIILTSEQCKDIADTLDSNGVLDKIDKEFYDLVKGSSEFEKKFAEKGGLIAGVGTGTWATVNAKKSKKKKWETIIKKWEHSHLNYDLFLMERWDRVSPRYSELITGNICLPTENWIINESLKEDKISVYFFLDTSGSCYHLKDRFFKAARSLDPKRFHVRLFSFDTAVAELDIKKNNVYGGGGTCFQIIENKIQQICKKENKRYPKACFIITDGYGTQVKPEKPERWNWFLTSSNSKSYIPSKSKTYLLNDYE